MKKLAPPRPTPRAPLASEPPPEPVASGVRATPSAPLGSSVPAPEPPLGPELAADSLTELVPGTVTLWGEECARESSPEAELPKSAARPKKDAYIGANIDGRYQVEALLGEGGMGVVYRCTHTIIGKTVAMKLLRGDLRNEPDVAERFLNEAKAASAVGNPHIIDISDFGRMEDGAPYFVMEYLNGTPLSKLLDTERRLPCARILDIAKQIAEGLGAAHAMGVVHRDLKPDNIFLVERGERKDFVKILDFGIAKLSVEEGKLTRAGAVFGTPHYMSPEQASGSPVDRRGDIYSLGVIIYELASGQVPFDADNYVSILTQHVYKQPVPMRARVDDPESIPAGLDAIVLKCLAKSPDDRYASMHELLQDLGRLGAGHQPLAWIEQEAERGPRSALLLARRSWPLLAGLCAFGALIGLVALWSFAPPIEEGGALPAASEPREPSPRAAQAPSPKAPLARGAVQVVVGTEPVDAHLFLGEEDLGPSPVVLQVLPGEPVVLIARKKGYKDAQVSVDAREPRAIVKLERWRSSGERSKKDGAPSGKKPAMGSSDIVNPWGD